MIEKLIAKVNSLDDLSSRKVSALVGAMVGDAACLHLEWIYDQDKVLKIVKQSTEPAFWPENHNPFFALPNGQLSGYADQALQVLNVMEENNGKQFDANKVVAHFLKFFGDATASPYQESLRKRREGKFPIEAQCLKITQNVAFEFFLRVAFFTNFCPIKTDLSGNTVRPQASSFQKLAKMDHFWHF